MATIQSIRGTKDILPADVNKWQELENIARKVSNQFGYQEIRTPIFEKTEVFSRGVGDNTDIVNKEMYTFADRSGESLTLRPEQTASLVRSVIQNNLITENTPTRLFYIGSYFRYERPQKGRFREFHQYGIECINSPYPESDVEVILLAINFIKRLGITDYKLKLNSIGNTETRNKYKTALTDYLQQNKHNLSNESQARIETNTLRVLDSKNNNDIEIIASAPSILDYLDNESNEHFNKVKEILDIANINYEITPTLVRGLDYYSHTVFEFQSTYLGAQDAFGGGGRYNNLFSQLGGKDIPSVGFAMGIERLLLILENIKENNTQPQIDILICTTNSDYLKYATELSLFVRQNCPNIICISDVNRRSLKSLLREANKLNSRYVIIIGETEAANNTITLKYMQENKEQITINKNKLIEILTA
ncbi:MAG: histidine--tRNA ligase [Bacteroidetes bacterium]|nr:histidine--tRNA ligase [Bacteroidota bacterium]